MPDRAGRDSHLLRLQVQVHLPQDLFAQLVFFQQVPKLAHRVFRCRCRKIAISLIDQSPGGSAN
jgi:hypothetical protein